MERFRKRQKIFNNRNEQLQRLLQKQQYQQDSPQSLPSYTVPPSPNPNLISSPHPSSEYQSSTAEENDDFDNEAEESYIASSVALLNRLRESIPPLATQIDQQQLDDNLNPELFIELVRQYPCIWNVRLNVYRDQSKKKGAWDEIKNVLDGNFTGRFVYCFQL